MEVLVSFVGGWGHLEPLLPLAHHATARGHDVVFAGQASVVGRLAADGAATVAVGPDTVTGERRPLVPVDRAMEQQVVAEHFVALYGARRDAALSDVIARHASELVICDEMDVGAVLAAERAGIRCVTVGVLAAGRLGSPAVVGAAWQTLRAERALPPDPSGARFGGSLRLTPAPASFRDPALPSPFDLHHVRPFVLDEPVTPGEGPSGPHHSPAVYATLGTVFDVESGDLFDRLAHGIAATNRDALLTVGHHVSPNELPPVGSRVRIESFVPQRVVLPRCGVVVCHGGSGTTIAALALGVPLVVLPMGADQPDNADRIQALGAGIALDALTASADDIAAAVETVLTEPGYRAAARQLAAEAAAQPALATLTDDVFATA